ncbi:MAG: hypothetical protein KC454_05045 [Flavobacteriales bacterium]|nr:hypothetical protein [Flavobacteriales bacterium]
MNQAKFYKTLVIILILLNLGTVFSMWYNRPPHHPEREKHKISTILQLEGDAKETVDQLEIEHHKAKKQLMHEDRRMHNELYLLIGKEADPKGLLEDIHFNKVKIEAMTFKYFDKIGKQCNEEQLKELKEFIKKALHNLSGHSRKVPHNAP